MQYENATQIKLLEKEMVDMDESYAELSGKISIYYLHLGNRISFISRNILIPLY